MAITGEKIRKNISGIEIIMAERHEQLNVHEFTIVNDKLMNSNGELIKAAEFCISIYNGNPDPDLFPDNWNPIFKEKWLRSKTPSQLLAIAGAFMAAELDRIQIPVNTHLPEGYIGE